MNCDQAFEHLTDPEQGDAAALQAHLDGCPRCRDMAEILEPALRYVNGVDNPAWRDWEEPESVLEESLAAGPFLSEQAVQVAEEAAKTLSTRGRGRQSKNYRRLIPLLTLAPLLALGLFWIGGRNSAAVPAGNGECTRDLAAAMMSDDQEEGIANAYHVVLSCNVCHLYERPGEGGEHLKLQRESIRESWLQTPALELPPAENWDADSVRLIAANVSQKPIG